MMEEHSEPSLIFHSDPGRESHPIMSSEISVRFKHGKKTPFLEEGSPKGIIEGDATSLCLQIVKLEEDTHFKDELNPGERTAACTPDVTPDVVLQIKPDAELDCKDEQSCIQIGLDNTSWTATDPDSSLDEVLQIKTEAEFNCKEEHNRVEMGFDNNYCTGGAMMCLVASNPFVNMNPAQMAVKKAQARFRISDRNAEALHNQQEEPETLDFHCKEILNDFNMNLADTVDMQLGKTKKHTGEKVKDSTIAEWQIRFPWLQAVTDNKGCRRLKCKVCVLAKTGKGWGQGGSPNVQISTVSRHSHSSEHRNAEKKIAQLAIANGDYSRIDEECDGRFVIEADKDKRLFYTVYYAAMEELPSEKVKSLIELQAQIAAISESATAENQNYMNVNWDTIKNVQGSIASVLENELFGHLKQSPVYGIMVDESQDLSTQKKLTMCIRYLNKGEPTSTFLCNLNVDDAKAETVASKITEKLKSIGLDISRLVSLGTDGGTVMVSSETGVGVQLRATNSPFLVQTHCLAYRLNLVCTDSMRNIPHLVTFAFHFNSLFNLFSTSPIRRAELKKVYEVLEDPVSKIKEAHAVNWSALMEAVQAVHSSYTAVAVALSELAENGNLTACSLYKYFGSYEAAIINAFMLDIHSVVAILCRELQKQTLLYSEIQPLLDVTVSGLDSLLIEDGDHLKKLRQSITLPGLESNCIVLEGVSLSYDGYSSSEFNLLREQYVASLKRNIQKRFPKEDITVFTNLGNLLEPSTVLENSDSEIKESLNGLSKFFGQAKKVQILNNSEDMQVESEVPPPLDGKALLKEWPLLHGMIKGSYKDGKMTKVCKRVINLHGNLLPNFAKLCQIALCLSVTSVECEQVFTTHNRIKTKFRCCSENESIDTLMKIMMLGPTMAEFDPTDSVKLWYATKRKCPSMLSWVYRPSAKKTKLNPTTHLLLS